MTSSGGCCDRRGRKKFAGQNKPRRNKPRRNEEFRENGCSSVLSLYSRGADETSSRYTVEGCPLVFGPSRCQVPRPGQGMQLVNFGFQGLATDHRPGPRHPILARYTHSLYSLAILAPCCCIHPCRTAEQRRGGFVQGARPANANCTVCGFCGLVFTVIAV
jgi:hypothetical protein